MSNFALFIVVLLIVFPVFYVFGAYLFLASIGKKYKASTWDIFKFICSRISKRNTIKFFGLTCILGLGIYVALLSDMDQSTFMKALILFDIILLLETVFYSVKGQIRFKDFPHVINTKYFLNTHASDSSHTNMNDTDWTSEFIPGGAHYEASEWMDKMREF